MTDRFDILMARFGVWDVTIWSQSLGCWLRDRSYSDGAWLEGRSLEPINFWGA